jgi:alpha-tubulin suppressor-like RCC1 family protein
LASYTCGTNTCRYRNTAAALSSLYKYSAIVGQRAGFCGIVASGATTGRVACWGENFGQQLGIPSGGTDTLRTAPVLINDTTTFTRLAGTSDTFCGVAARDNLTYCWGGAAWGIKGAAQAVTTGNSASYTHLTSLLNASLTFTALGQQNGTGAPPVLCGIAGGQVYCWGYNGWGGVGTGTANTQRNIPAVVTGVPGTATSVSSSGFHTCATNAAGEVYCWGANNAGQLGATASSSCTGGGADPQYNFATQPLQTTSCAPAPLRVPTSLTFSSVVATGAQYIGTSQVTCAIRPTGVAYCWGNGALGSPGGATTTPRLIAAPAN